MSTSGGRWNGDRAAEGAQDGARDPMRGIVSATTPLLSERGADEDAVHLAVLDDAETRERSSREASTRRRTPREPIVPSSTIASSALIAVVAIMTFLAAFTIGSVAAVRGMMSEWSADIGRETTIQIRPADGLDMDAALAKSQQVAQKVPGVAGARIMPAAETAALLEPWLGAGLDVASLPLPRMVVVALASSATADTITQLRDGLSSEVPSASLDDHRQWSDRLAGTGRTAMIIGLSVLALVSAATVLSVVFATRAAVAAARPIVEVLHFVGAHDGFIAAEFQQHFLHVGLRGGIIGGVAAMAAFFLFSTLPGWLGGGGDQPTDTLVGSLHLDLYGYGGIAGAVVMVALVTSITSRVTVYRTLRRIS
ncbi:cell division protein [Ancylobacter sp. 6x-1]|uniref:Cell division protein n=1 Tax=Ancylobacter crimeensis TaxID=2579147 RepID=A0ABT0DD06_9HYPH|nr:cell division protein [Ancylobacter crimeensis]MCK0197841.1 cell division protein [Ancylobacter crimeensis]